MFFIVGARPRAEVLRTLTMVCWSCQQAAAHRLTRLSNHITLFFIPLIPLGTKHELQCLLCGVSQHLTPESVGDVLAAPVTTAGSH